MDTTQRGGRRGRRRAARPRWWRRWWWRIGGGAVLLVVVAVVVARLVLPGYLERYVNRTLDQSPEYDGRIGKVTVSLWRGAYTIHDVEIVKTTHSVAVPFFESPRVDLSVDWEALLHGVARGRIVMEKPRLNFVHGPSVEETQTGANQPWLRIIDDLFPFRIDKAEVRDGEMAFHAFHTRPEVHAHLTEVQATVTNLTNVEDEVDPLIAEIQATGRAEKSGKFEFRMSLDPQAHRPSFEIAARVLDLDVTRLRDLTRAYGDFDFESGRFDLVVEVAVRDGFMDGYAKPLFRDLQVVSVRDLQTDDPLQVLWETLVGVVGEIFQNQPRNQFGTRLTLEGNFDNPGTDIVEIVGNVLRNAFVRAYLPRLEGRVAPGTVTEEEEADGDGPR